MIYIMYIIVFTISVYRYAITGQDISAWILQGLVLAFCARFILEEILQRLDESPSGQFHVYLRILCCTYFFDITLCYYICCKHEWLLGIYSCYDIDIWIANYIHILFCFSIFLLNLVYRFYRVYMSALTVIPFVPYRPICSVK